MKFEFLDMSYNPVPVDEAPTRFGFECPRNPGRMCSGLIIRGNPDGLITPNATWQWNGNREAPTFRPSIHCKGCAHGWITDGKWRDA